MSSLVKEGIFTPAARARIVEELLSQKIEIPQDLVSKSFAVLNEALQATETKFFSYKGYVRSTKVVVDHDTRLAASKEVFTIATLLTREKDAPPDDTSVAMEYDEKNGVLRVVVGPAVRAIAEARVSTVQQVSTPTPIEKVVEELDTLLGIPAPVRLKGDGPPKYKPPSKLDEILQGDLKQVIHDEVVD